MPIPETERLTPRSFKASTLLHHCEQSPMNHSANGPVRPSLRGMDDHTFKAGWARFAQTRSRKCVVPFLLMVCGMFARFCPAAEPPGNDPVCGIARIGNGKQGPGTLKMVAILQEMLRTADPAKNIFLSEQRAARLGLAKASATSPAQAASFQMQYGMELLRAGLSEPALHEFMALDESSRTNGQTMVAKARSALDIQIALSYLRMGEQLNCLSNHNADSCLFPLKGGGIHLYQDNARQAIQVLSEHLQHFPADLGGRWLLNIAHMTVGEYPAKVSPQWLIPPEKFASEYPMPRFPDGAAAAGLDRENLAGGCIADDFDGDGLIDLITSEWSLTGQLRFYHNNGDGTFAERTREAGLMGLVGGLNLIQADYNNDGFMDVVVLRGGWMAEGGCHPISLLRNNGDGTFEDVTVAAGLLRYHPTQTAAFFDFDGDGWIDLFVGNESLGAKEHPCELFHNNRDGTFTECADASGVAIIGFVKGCTSADYDGDGRPDLYLSIRGSPNVLFHNDGPATGSTAGHFAWQFTETGAKAGVQEPIFSFPTWFFDYDNDGRSDLFVAGYQTTLSDVAADYLGLEHKGERARLYHNNGDGTFSDTSRSVGLHKIIHAMGSNFGDLDNDGWLDFYAGTGDSDLSTLIPNRAFRNNGGTNFQEVTTSAGLGHLQKGHGIAFADFDNDGDQDIFAKLGGAYPGDIYRNALFVNPGNSNHWITLKLEGSRCNRAAIGARIKVVLDTGSGTRAVYKTVGSGGSFGASPMRQEIGLGGAVAIKGVEIFWPAAGKTQSITGLAMNRFYRIREEADGAEEYFPKKSALATDGMKSHSMHRHNGPELVP